MIKIIIFGVGKAFANNIDFFIQNSKSIEIIAFIDNADKYIEKKICDVPIYKPDFIKMLDYDGIVIPSQKYFLEIKEQLIALGVNRFHIWDMNYICHHISNEKKILCGEDIDINSDKEKVLIISTDMAYSGGTRVAVYAAQALIEMGKEVVLTAPSIIDSLLDELRDIRLSFALWKSLPYIYEEDKRWINRFDVILVNVFQMMNCAYEISKIKPVLWWIHEDRSIWKTFYQDTQEEFSAINVSQWMECLNIVGVSNIALEAFNHFYPGVIRKVLPFGIPDRYRNVEDKIKNTGDKVVFAVTAGVSEFKGQYVLIDALKKLSDKEKNQIEVWFIGPSGKSARELEEVCHRYELKDIKFLGLLSHEEVMDVFSDIDVIVCPSLIETMSMSVIEGLMFKKLCITSDMTGIAEYIIDGQNGFVFKSGDASELAAKISWIVNNRKQWNLIQIAARRTFDEEFSIEKFGEKLNWEIQKAKSICREKNKNVFRTL